MSLVNTIGIDQGAFHEFEFWRQRSTGRFWAVALVDGVVKGACGPLTETEVDDRFLRTFDYSPERAPWIESHRDAFDLLQLPDDRPVLGTPAED